MIPSPICFSMMLNTADTFFPKLEKKTISRLLFGGIDHQLSQLIGEFDRIF
jgi:hypothetical protein